MSFRFGVDSFDRYWTCWCLEGGQGTEPETDGFLRGQVLGILLGIPESGNFTSTQEETRIQHKEQAASQRTVPWRQRKVLELLLFDIIVRRMIKGANTILDVVSEWTKKLSDNVVIPLYTKATCGAGASNLKHSGVDHFRFLADSRQFEQLQTIIRNTEADLAKNIAKIEVWLNREKHREARKPRWTLNNELRYRVHIAKQLISNDRQLQELKRSHTKIKNFYATLEKNAGAETY